MFLCSLYYLKLTGKHKRDTFSDPIRSGGWQLQYLRNAAKWLANWQEQHKDAGMTQQTFLAWQQTLTGLADLAEDLLTNKGFEYFLSGRASSDPLEGT